MKIMFFILIVFTCFVLCNCKSKSNEEPTVDFYKVTNSMKTDICHISLYLQPSSPDDVGSSEILKEYPIGNLIDGDKKTTIVVRSDFFETPIITIEFEQAIPVDMIRVFSGYGKSRELYKLNSRSSTFRFTVSDQNNIGHPKTNWNVVNQLSNDIDYYRYYIADLENYIIISNKSNKHLIKEFFIVLNSGYRGTKYPKDFCLSEIQFWFGNKRYEINNIEEINAGFDYYKGYYAVKRTNQ